MTYVVYVLRSKEGKFYKGLTSNLERRLKEHRAGGTRTTSRMTAIEVVYTETCKSFAEARKRELYLKTSAGRRFIKKRLAMGR
ncbi:MAG: GIY-YIG nuclease family protein [Patescibacteria group bacterium]|nr:GIY-YIG nuclease family protein [Patescibacteria group bacterium]